MGIPQMNGMEFPQMGMPQQMTMPQQVPNVSARVDIDFIFS